MRRLAYHSLSVLWTLHYSSVKNVMSRVYTRRPERALLRVSCVINHATVNVDLDRDTTIMSV